MHYRDKVVIITGGTKGIGEGCVRSFVAAESKVVFCARNQEEGNALETELDGKAYFIKCDI